MRHIYWTVLSLAFWICLEAQFNKEWVFRHSVKCIQKVTKNESFSFKHLFLILYPTQDRYYSGCLQKIKPQTIFPSLLTLVVEKRLMAHERSAYWLFFQPTR